MKIRSVKGSIRTNLSALMLGLRVIMARFRYVKSYLVGLCTLLSQADQTRLWDLTCSQPLCTIHLPSVSRSVSEEVSEEVYLGSWHFHSCSESRLHFVASQSSYRWTVSTSSGSAPYASLLSPNALMCILPPEELIFHLKCHNAIQLLHGWGREALFSERQRRGNRVGGWYVHWFDIAEYS